MGRKYQRIGLVLSVFCKLRNWGLERKCILIFPRWPKVGSCESSQSGEGYRKSKNHLVGRGMVAVTNVASQLAITKVRLHCMSSCGRQMLYK